MAAKYPEDSVQAEDSSLVHLPPPQPLTASMTSEFERGSADYYDVFLVYAEEDAEYMQSLQKELETIDLLCGRKIITCSVDTVTPGMSIFEAFEEGVRKSNFVCVMITKNFENCKWANHLKNEALHEQIQNKTIKCLLVPVYVEEVSFEPVGIKSLAPIELFRRGIEGRSLTAAGKNQFKTLAERRTRMKFKVDNAASYEAGECLGKETQWCEFKERKEKKLASVVKEYASAFLNADGGKIYFGVNDKGIVQGIRLNVDECCRDIIEGMKVISPHVNDTLFKVHFVPVSNQKVPHYVIRITVAEGFAKPYTFTSKGTKVTYVRRGTRNDELKNEQINEQFSKVSTARLHEHFKQHLDFMENSFSSETNESLICHQVHGPEINTVENETEEAKRRSEKENAKLDLEIEILQLEKEKLKLEIKKLSN